MGKLIVSVTLGVGVSTVSAWGLGYLLSHEVHAMVVWMYVGALVALTVFAVRSLWRDRYEEFSSTTTAALGFLVGMGFFLVAIFLPT